MQRNISEISEEEYKDLAKLSYTEQHKKLFPNGIPDVWLYGYGYFGHEIYEDSGKYYVVHKIGDSCE